MTKSHERQYTITSHEGYFFHAGVSQDDAQLLMGLHCPNLLLFRFDYKGNYLGTEQREVPFFENDSPVYDIYDQRIPPLIKAWKEELQFRPVPIMVKKFFAENYHIGIEDYPSHFHEILADPATNAAEIADIRESMQMWDKNGQFVLWWGNDYWLNRAGEVVSS